MNLEGAVALVTGAAHRLGRAVALELARSGAHVVIHFGRSREGAERTAGEIEALGVEALALQADLSRPEEIDRLFESAGERFGGLDLLVNSAASFERKSLEEITAEDFDAVMAVNLRAPLLCIRRAAPWMRLGERRAGSPAAVVNISDLAGVEPWRGYAHHGASKAGLLHLTRIAAAELAPSIRVNAVVPGAILPPPGEDPEGEAWRRRGESIPAGRTGHPSDVARSVAHLAESDFITGAVLRVDGGEGLGGR